MIEATHTLHTHIRSTLDIYNVFHHLLLWHGHKDATQPDIYSSGLRVKVAVVGECVGSTSTLVACVMIEA